MSDNAPNQAPSSLQYLRTLREKFTEAQNDNQERLAEVNRQIAAAERAIAEENRKQALKQIVAGDDAGVLGKHDIQFLINNTKEGGKGANSPLASAVSAAYKVYQLVASAGVKDTNVAVGFWGDKWVMPMQLGTQFGATKFNTSVASARAFLPAAKNILNENTPDNVKDKNKNYIILCNTSVTDDIAHAATILEAAAKLNPKATFDFVVCGTEATNIETLVKKWSETASGQKPNFVKVETPQEIAAAVLNIVKSRISGEAYTQWRNYPPISTRLSTTAP